MMCFGLKVTISWTVWLHQAVASFKRTSSWGRWHLKRWIKPYFLLPSSSDVHRIMNFVYSGMCYSVDRPIEWFGKRSEAEISCLDVFQGGNLSLQTNLHLYPIKINSLRLFICSWCQGKMTMKRKNKSKNIQCGQSNETPSKTMIMKISIQFKMNKNKGCRNRDDF